MSRTDYPEDLMPLILEGRVRPKNGRILCRAVTFAETDETARKVARATGQTIEETVKKMKDGGLFLDDSGHLKTAPYHEVVAVAPDIEDDDIKPGALVQFVTAAADFAADKRYVFVKAAHIIACEAA